MDDIASLDRFIKHYRQQLAVEKNELLSCSTSCNQFSCSSDGDESREGRLSNHLTTRKLTDFTNPDLQSPTGHGGEDASKTNLSFPSEGRRDDAVRVRKQADYRRCLDRQIAEKRQRKSDVKETLDLDRLETVSESCKRNNRS